MQPYDAVTQGNPGDAEFQADGTEQLAPVSEIRALVVFGTVWPGCMHPHGPTLQLCEQCGGGRRGPLMLDWLGWLGWVSDQMGGVRTWIL